MTKYLSLLTLTHLTAVVQNKKCTVQPLKPGSSTSSHAMTKDIMVLSCHGQVRE